MKSLLKAAPPENWTFLKNFPVYFNWVFKLSILSAKLLFSGKTNHKNNEAKTEIIETTENNPRKSFILSIFCNRVIALNSRTPPANICKPFIIGNFSLSDRLKKSWRLPLSKLKYLTQSATCQNQCCWYFLFKENPCHLKPQTKAMLIWFA